MDERMAARGVGWFGVGLGLIELFAPKLIQDLLGMRGNTLLLRLFGVREIVTSVPLALTNTRAPWLWARVVGDVLDVGCCCAASKRARLIVDAAWQC